MTLARSLRLRAAALLIVTVPLRIAAAEPARGPAPATTKSPSGRNISYNNVTTGPRSPEEERLSFTLPAGFEAELVVAESAGFGKFVNVTWDARMRLWSMTALEYPVDGNEQKAASDALFAAGGRDKVVVFDSPYATPAPGQAAVSAPPRVFADGLVMPLGVQPYKDGAFIQYGADIRLYRDTDADGRAERHEVILTSFGTQDSHLFPHQFLRQPGGQMFVAQGLFNYSKVRRPGGRPFADGTTEVAFNQCKLGRFTLDGSRFESLTAGPNNIWGLVTSREGETFFQEANDQGYPVIPYEPGIWVNTGSKDRLRPYQPLMPPPLAPAQIGGTGLSGLALAEDRDSPFAKFASLPSPTVGHGPARIFFLANPITNTINTVKATPEAGLYRFEKLPDFLTTTDRWFRPVAIHFGPDGALYIVDWYNKIISHNEVPRAHPDRDKSRGRIWRIRHRDQPRTVPPDLTQLDERALVAQLGGPHALVSRLAWLELIDRNATGVATDLATLVADRATPNDRRLAALWALESLAPIGSPLLQTLAADPTSTVRHEAVRIAAAYPRTESEFISIARPLLTDPSPSVRAALGDALRRVPNASARVMAIAAQLGRESLPTATPWPRYEREFERYLARWAMELNPAATLGLLNSPEGRALPLENRLLATLALGGKDAAIGLARLAPELTRPLGEEEIRALAAHFAEPAVRDTLSQSLAQPATRNSILRALLTLRISLDTTPLTPELTAAANSLLASADAADTTLGAQVAGAFKLPATEPGLTALLTREVTPTAKTLTPSALAALRALRENATGPVGMFERLARESTNATVRDEALAALAASRAPDAPLRLVQLLPALTIAQRGTALDRLAGTAPGASAIVAGLRAGTVTKADVGVSTADKLRTLLPSDPTVAALWKEIGGDVQRALRLDGGNHDFAATQLTLTGPFTVECWAKLDPTISNLDALLGAPGRFALNFHAAQLRVWIGGGTNDIVVAKRKTAPRVWTHYAVTRDAEGVFKIYINGEFDATSTTVNSTPLGQLDVGRTNPKSGGTAGWLAEFRVWNVARSAKELRENFDRSFVDTSGTSARPAGLTHAFGGANWGALSGQARVDFTDDAPALFTPAEAAVQDEKFARFRTLANTRGNPESGKELFTSLCLACHQHGGKGGQIAPALDGVGNTGVEALLRNILTPSAAMESAYRTFRVVTRDGRVQEGFLIEETAAAIALRNPGAEDRRIPREEIQTSAYLRRSLMPEGLLENMAPAQVSDLFAYLNSLR